MGTENMGTEHMGTEHRVVTASLAEKGWYPEDTEQLTQVLEQLFQDASTSSTSENRLLNPPKAIIIPHAGYRYSGKTAAKAIQALKGHQYSKVIIMGPSHYYPLNNLISLPQADAYKTPFGNYPIDNSDYDKLLDSEFFSSIPEIHAQEHSIQIELPLLQYIGFNTPILPMVVGQLQDNDCREIAAIIKEIMDENSLIIISTDFTHYGNSFGYLPFSENIQENLKDLDLGAVALLKNKDFQGFCDYIKKTQATICGRDSLKLLLQLIDPNAEAHVLDYMASAELNQNWSHSVSYVGMVYS